MNWTKFANRAALAAALFLTLAAGTCENGKVNMKVVLERMPAHYRQCAERVVVLPKGDITFAEAKRLLVKLRESELRQNRCLKGAIAWADAQFNAYAK